MKRLYLLLFLIAFTAVNISAQRKTDKLDRGLVAVKKASGVFLSWRIQADEYYDVTYNVYRNGTKINSEPLTVSNYTDASGAADSQYYVTAVYNGAEQSPCAAVTPWSNRTGNGPHYLPIKVADVKDRNGVVVWQNNNGTVTKTQDYSINDISLGDVDGDGKIDFIVKRINDTDRDNLFPTTNTTAFCRIEVYTSKKNYQLSWYIDCGPNTVYGPDEPWDAVAFDWDMDGKCEVLYRAYANTIIHKSDGSTVTIGSVNENIRAYVTHTANMTYTNCGNEYLVYINGETGEPYTSIDYPLKRLESSEFSTSINWDSPTQEQVDSYLNAVNTAWGDKYGHRSSKYFMGAPYLDGRKPSIYLGRGIYTRTKMIAYDVDPNSHALTEKWVWSNNAPGSGWFGQGYHNYSIADVDEDGCDEIVYGSMVIDSNGKGLSTTGLGHGDAHHVGDLDPFRKGMELFACNEDEPGNNFRNAATSEIYYRKEAADDDGRSMADNFSNDYPGCIGASANDGIISLSSCKVIKGIVNDWNNNTPNPIALNFRIYWDGDLLSETLNSPGAKTNGYVYVDKWGSRIFDAGHGNYETATINGTKNNPNAQGDIIGDWREEIIIRSSDNTEFRIYTTTDPTEFRIPSLWYDHQYRQAMVWQTEAYNQPPHVSFFMGEMEELTKVPVPLTNEGRTEITANSTITPECNGKKMMFVVPTTGNANFSFKGKISPAELIVNVPTLVSGNNDNNNITYNQRSCTIGYSDGSSGIEGSTHFVKQGEGLLILPNKTLSYTGDTEVWGGTMRLDRTTLSGSNVWMNRHTTLLTNGTIKNSLTMEYGSTLAITGTGAMSGDAVTATIGTLELHEGARVVFDIDPTNSTNTDVLNLEKLTIRKRNWTYGPEYLAPVLEFKFNSTLTPGEYPLGTLTTVSGNLNDIILEGDFPAYCDAYLVQKDGKLYLEVVENNKRFIGKTDYSTGWWQEFSDSYTIKSGYKYNFKFTNYGGSTEKHYNWLLVVANGSGHSTADRSDYAEHFVLRADNYGWGGGMGSGSSTGITHDYNWSTFLNDMKEADVDMDITFENGVFKMNATITCKTGKTYAYSYTSSNISAEQVSVFFTVEHSYMTEPEFTEEPTNVIGAQQTIDATLSHTASTYRGATTNPISGTVDAEKEFYNVQGSQANQGYAFAEFTYNIPAGALITSATLTWHAINKSNGGDRNNDVYYLNKGISLDYDKISNNPELLRYHNQKVLISSVTWASGTSTKDVQNIDTDVKDAVASMASEGKIIFEWTNNPGGADLLGKGSSNPPTLSISYISPSNLILEPKAVDNYDEGIYTSVTVNRNFKEGYSTLCVPFNTTISEFAPDDYDAYVAKFSGVEIDGSTTTLIFSNDTQIKANTPYILYISEPRNAPVFIDKPVLAESPKTITYGDWSMSGNYQVDKSMYGLYGVADNIDIRRGGSNSKLNGLTAYLTGPVNGSAKARIVDSNGATIVENVKLEDEATVTAIYTINGTKVTSLQPGINILKMSDGSVRKVMRK